MRPPLLLPLRRSTSTDRYVHTSLHEVSFVAVVFFMHLLRRRCHRCRRQTYVPSLPRDRSVFLLRFHLSYFLSLPRAHDEPVYICTYIRGASRLHDARLLPFISRKCTSAGVRPCCAYSRTHVRTIRVCMYVPYEYNSVFVHGATPAVLRFTRVHRGALARISARFERVRCC